MLQGRFRLVIRKIFFTEMVGKHWNRLSKEVGELPPVKVFRKCVAIALEDMV